VSDTELLPKSKPEPARRLEVFTGAGRRRAWTAEQKARIVCESYESDEKVSAVARRHGLTPQQLFGWRREARRQGGGQRMGDVGGVSGGAFASVIVTEPNAAAPMAPCHTDGAAIIEIVIGATTVRVAPGIDAVTLATVLRAVRVAAA
jgi:transposase